MPGVCHKGLRTICAVAAALAIPVPTGIADDGVLKINESTFNEFGAVIQPLKFKGRKETWFCDSDWTATVKNLHFSIMESRLSVTGDISAKWCFVPFEGSLDATGDVVLAEGIGGSQQQAVVVTINSAPVTIVVTMNVPMLGEVTVPVTTVDATPYLSVPPIPLGPAMLGFETGLSMDVLSVRPVNLSLRKRNGYVELRSDVTVQ